MKQICSLVLLLLILAITGCQNEGRWYPDAEASIGNYSEYATAAGGRALAVTVVVHNTSSTSITSGTVTVRAVTDRREYLKTAGFTTKINPDGKVSLSISVEYLDPDEFLISDGISLYDSFFD